MHETLTRLKAQPHTYPIIDLAYSPSQPVSEPIVLALPSNGLRLRFDGPEQRLRLIEVLDFTRNRLAYKGNEIAKSATVAEIPSGIKATKASGPTFRHVYSRLFGPTFPGEYIPPSSEESSQGTYVLSYPGIAFSFPLQSQAWSPKKDFVSVLSSSAAAPASAMAIFSGTSWTEACRHLYSNPALLPASPLLTGRTEYTSPDEISLVKIHGEGQVELIRRGRRSFWIKFGETTLQDLITELGAPDAIYRKNDRRLSIHGAHPHESVPSPGRRTSSSEDDETGQSSSQNTTDDSEDDGHAAVSSVRSRQPSEYFYNYFRYGFDVFVSNTRPQSLPEIIHETSPEMASVTRSHFRPTSDGSHLSAAKLLLHGNIPGSYPFNRYRRIRWTLDYLSSESELPLSSETAFSDISQRLRSFWEGIYRDEEEERQLQKGMVLNRGWGDSPGSSCELLGGWEDSQYARGRASSKGGTTASQTLGNTELFGFPGTVFEVLGNGVVSCLTVF